jgi:hypothetical protein
MAMRSVWGILGVFRLTFGHFGHLREAELNLGGDVNVVDLDKFVDSSSDNFVPGHRNCVSFIVKAFFTFETACVV